MPGIGLVPLAEAGFGLGDCDFCVLNVGEGLVVAGDGCTTGGFCEGVGDFCGNLGTVGLGGGLVGGPAPCFCDVCGVVCLCLGPGCVDDVFAPSGVFPCSKAADISFFIL